MVELVGRKPERELFNRTMQSAEAELITVYGRRRVGKTFLIREYFRPNLEFELTGIHDASLTDQLENFAHTLASVRGRGRKPLEIPSSWHEAFRQLTAWFKKSRAKKRKRVLFFDELPWLATPRSKFVAALDHFWNTWASRQPNLIVVICGSAASWMIKNVVQHRGGLHNRITRRVRLEPFTLGETRTYLESRRVRLNDRQILELYFAMGGVPHYLKEIEPGQSAAQNIDRICFSPGGLLRDEFDRLYTSLFEHSERHVRVIQALATKRKGLTRDALLHTANLKSGGGSTRLINELLESGFVMQSTPFGKRRKDALYRLADEYSLFYLNWIQRHRAGEKNVWIKKQSTRAWRAWSGYAFENVCLKHRSQLKAALGIGAVETVDASWLHRETGSSDPGAQIDLLIDRQDQCINVCEMKFSPGEFIITKRYAAELRAKLETFRRVTKTRKAPFLTLVTAGGLRQNEYAIELVTAAVDASSLFSA